jgi:hypothetical protein
MRREKPKRRKPRGESTDAGAWGGSIRRSVEDPVMGRSKGIGSGSRISLTNWKQDDFDRYDKQAVQD